MKFKCTVWVNVFVGVGFFSNFSINQVNNWSNLPWLFGQRSWKVGSSFPKFWGMKWWHKKRVKWWKTFVPAINFTQTAAWGQLCYGRFLAFKGEKKGLISDYALFPGDLIIADFNNWLFFPSSWAKFGSQFGFQEFSPLIFDYWDPNEFKTVYPFRSLIVREGSKASLTIKDIKLTLSSEAPS